MKRARTKSPVVRGDHPIEISMPWRLDGAGTDPRAPLVLCLHGMGMEEDFFALLLQGLFTLPARFLIPRGPYPVEVRREGRIGASWYAYDGDQDRFRSELEKAEGILLGLLRRVEEERGLRPKSRWLLGFSQGGYLGGWVALRHPELFSGMVVSGARVKTEFLEEAMPRAADLGFRVLLCHGRRDASVLPEVATRSRDALAAAGIDVELESLDAGHSVGRKQIEAISRWFRAHVVRES